MREYDKFSFGRTMLAPETSSFKEVEKRESFDLRCVERRYDSLSNECSFQALLPIWESLVLAFIFIESKWNGSSTGRISIVRSLPFLIIPGRIWVGSIHRFVLMNCFIMLNATIDAQFEDVSDAMGIYLEGNYPFYGNGVSFCDFNEDGWDDITATSNGYGVYVFQNTGSGFVLQPFFMSITGDCKHPIWVDFDNDGDKDFFVSRVGLPLVLFRNEGGFNFTDVSYMFNVDATYAASVNVAWADYDVDGFPDVYVCNHQNSSGPESWLFHNDAGQGFTEVGSQLNVGNGVSKTFQALWSDYDADGDQDLMVVNDMWQGCRLYQQQPDGSFIDVASNTGFNIEAHCMGLGVFDYDHDGDLNYYITNSEEAGGNILLEYQNGQFVNLASDYGILVNQWCWGLSFIDRDNTGYEDLYVVSATLGSEESTYFDYNPQSDFTELDVFSGMNNKRTYAVAKGDFDRDGRCDLVSTHISPVDMTLWHNEHISGNWIRITLHGVESNKDAIGALVKIYHGGIYTSRVLTCGDNYMSQDSQHLHFGLAEHEQVDSLHIYWPNGTQDKYYGLAANEDYEFYETTLSVSELEIPLMVQVCPGQSPQQAILNSGLVAASDSILTTTSEWLGDDMYEITYLTESGEEETISVFVSFIPSPDVTVEVVHPSCHGYADGSIFITSVDSISIFYWEEEEVPNVLANLPASVYTITFNDLFNCPHVLTCELLNPAPIELNQATDSICSGANIFFQPQAFGGSGVFSYHWADNSTGPTLPGSYDLIVEDDAMCSAEFTVDIIELSTPEIALGTLSYCPGSTLELNCSDLSLMDAVSWIYPGYDPMELTSGNYSVIAVADNGCSDTMQFEVQEIDMPAASLSIINGQNDCTMIDLVTDDEFISSYQWSDGSSDQDILCAEEGTYTCTLTTTEGCVMELNCTVSDLSETTGSALQVFPNPVIDVLWIPSLNNDTFELFDSDGRLIDSFNVASGKNKFEVGQLVDGLYFLRGESGRLERFTKLAGMH